MAAVVIPSPSSEGGRDFPSPSQSPTPATSHPPSSFDPSRIPSGNNSTSGVNSSPGSTSPSNVANVLNTRPTYDRSTSQLGRYDSKRSSMISNTSFQTAPLVAGSAYGGGSVYGTADGGSSRESLDTVQGYVYEAPNTPGVPPVIHATGPVNEGFLNNLLHPKSAAAAPLDGTESSPSKTIRPGTSDGNNHTSNPGNDLPAHLVTGPSPIDVDSAKVKAAVAAFANGVSNPESQPIPVPGTPPRKANIFLDTNTIHSSPSHSPSVSRPDGVGIHSAIEEAQAAESAPEGADSTSAPGTQNTAAGSRTQSRSGSLLHPSSALSANANTQTTTGGPSSVKPTRRNTTGSTGMVSKSKAGSSTVAMSSTTTGVVASTTVLEGWDLALDEDMRKQAEHIRRERKRREEEAEEEEKYLPGGRDRREGKGKEKGHSRSGSVGGRSVGGRSAGGKSLDEWRPVVGNVVGEGHVNYILMYNMLTGIRVAVSRCQAKAPRPLTDEDYTAAHKYNFDVIGNELTPSAKYDFKFKDYAPWVFRSLREDSFNIDPADYLLSLTSKYILSELGSPGKSGSFFYYSRDYRFIIKTIRAIEHKWLRRVLKDYYRHVKDNPHTLISRFYGLHRVKLPRGKKIHFVIMNNLFPAHRDIHETYDLKGSTVGRHLPASKLEDNPGAVMKDMNWIERGRVLEFGPYKRALLTEQLRRDVEFLKSIGVMDYSLLVGLHSVKRGNKENIRSNTLKVFKPDIKDVPDMDAPIGARKWIGIKHAMEVRRAILVAQRQHQTTIGASTSATGENASATPQRVRKVSAGGRSLKPSPLHTLESSNLPEEDPLPSDRSGFIFYSDDGGYRATDDLDREWRGGLGGRVVVDGKIQDATEVESDGNGVVYYLGIIDILTRWTLTKRMEHIYKGLKANKHKISPVNPIEYGERFFAFLQAVMRGGEGGERFV
ncbi:Phosphatidylinositol 4-phosphate 5-kinase its3; AltName: Full=1-phosphatidylinositol 4-phosphate kinase; AltName: Full=Diphosphoinositide kinase; AltName: Full=PIP5K; AltName: Full=PtdIns(4)P-5-kinase [Serendipita indica DSM 11827]|nr:Phosphatidylinositol 4-phosphate 5-kinase its3; AltName: Full=1-phosphatidylinositol 4-phosphate kinase; AltName: Full=Diphosphoinositide kinase; AltName: Full=PIP5K; AltName: Full=PtdIns(4)P-5-kinase [Serendipita indica DSM 11827]